ncbi:MAG: family 20 glycosylhydrolase [Bacteroidota bacterium]
MKNINISFSSPKSYLLILILILIPISSSTFSQSKTQKLDLMPYPQKIEIKEGKFRLTPDFTIAIKGSGNERIYKSASRTLRRIANRTGLFLLQDFITNNDETDTCDLIISCLKPGKVILGEDESYSLNINERKIYINASTDLGAMHGIETLLQLIAVDEEGYYLPAIKIDDFPRFPWRGLLIDVCRHFMPVDVIKRNLDGLAAVKMNVFHWHLSEDQGFRVESKIYPKLHELGSDGFYYTQEEVKDVINYAAERGIRVIPEFDVPGHATSWFVGYPELASAPGPYKIERNWGIMNPTFNPTIEETYTFLDNLFGEMCELFPDEYFHIGGDENNGKQWDANEGIQKFMKENGIEDNHALQAYFNNRILKTLTKYGKKMIGWDEILHENMPKNIVIHSWRGKEALVKSAQQGYMGILSNGYYIDLIQPASFHYLNDPIAADSPLSESEKKKILGGEATSWAELVTYETIDSRIWPRTAAIAERLWSAQNVIDVDGMYKRLDRIEYLLEEHGLLHIKNYDMMLRRLTNNTDFTALKNLVDVVEPVKFYQRHFQGVKYRQHSPYSRIADAARPESKTAREFSRAANNFLENANKEDCNYIKDILINWIGNRDKLKTTMNVSPIIREIEPLSNNLKLTAQLTLDAIELIELNIKPDLDWTLKSTSILEKAKKPYGQVELRVIDAMEKIIKKCCSD